MSSEEDGKRALAAIASAFPSRRERLHRTRRIYLDTFDWRLYRRDLRLWLVSDNGNGMLCLECDEEIIKERLPRARIPEFARDLPDGPVRERLASVIDVRRLLPRAEIEDAATGLRILDDEQKTVARVQLVNTSASIPDAEKSSGFLDPTLEVIPVRGYETAIQGVRHYLEGDLGLAPASRATARAALELVGQEAGMYSSKVELPLNPAMTAGEATIFICSTLVDAMEANEDGVRRDLDPEFLHDFRVAGRRTRSALALMGKVFDREARKHFRREFKWLGSVTGPVRDLDVHLMQMDALRASLHEEARNDLEPLDRYLRRHRSTERRRLTAALRSKRYRTLVREWREFLHRSRSEAPTSATAAQPITEFASKRIWRAFRRVEKRAPATASDTPPESLHELRIECKKLRYLLEFFYSLYDDGDIGPLVKALKRLQDNLGDFNDRVVQAKALSRMAIEMEQEGLATVECLLAIGRLLEKQDRAQRNERRRFAKCFAAFDDAGNRQRFARLFHPPAGER